MRDRNRDAQITVAGIGWKIFIHLERIQLITICDEIARIYLLCINIYIYLFIYIYSYMHKIISVAHENNISKSSISKKEEDSSE